MKNNPGSNKIPQVDIPDEKFLLTEGNFKVEENSKTNSLHNYKAQQILGKRRLDNSKISPTIYKLAKTDMAQETPIQTKTVKELKPLRESSNQIKQGDVKDREWLPINHHDIKYPKPHKLKETPKIWYQAKTKAWEVKTAETVALEDALDMAIGIGRQVVQIQTGLIQDTPIPIRAYTDSNSLIESLKSTKQVEEGPTRPNVARIKYHLKQHLVSEIKWVPTHLQLADPLTKAKADPTALKKVLKSGFLKRPD